MKEELGTLGMNLGVFMLGLTGGFIPHDAVGDLALRSCDMHSPCGARKDSTSTPDVRNIPFHEGG